jgi:hypothetical protein
VNLNIKTARSGNHYVELDTYEAPQGGKPKAEEKSAPAPQAPPKVAEPEDDGDLPF